MPRISSRISFSWAGAFSAGAAFRLSLAVAVAQTGQLAAAEAPASVPAPGAPSAPAAAPVAAKAAPAAEAPAEPAKKAATDPPGMKRLSPNFDVWLDPVKKRVVLDGAVCLREGYLEMFVCPKNTKEHESIIACDIDASIVHAALLALGAKPGSPAKWQPKYEPATGTPIDITLIWTDEKGVVHRDAAQQWIRNSRNQAPLDSTWVFAGSNFRVDPDGSKHYRADEGDFICVSNFPDAMLDLPVESSEANEERMFEAFTEHIPPKGTRVRLVLTPRL